MYPLSLIVGFQDSGGVNTGAELRPALNFASPGELQLAYELRNTKFIVPNGFKIVGKLSNGNFIPFRPSDTVSPAVEKQREVPQNS